MSSNKRDLYREAGVDVAKGDSLVGWLQQTDSQAGESGSQLGHALAGIGGFAALYKPQWQDLKEPLLVSSTDGVGTKLLLGLQYERCAGLGQDLVGMCVNDLYTIGARPLFFLDYYATGELNEEQFKQVLSGIRQGLQLSNAVLLGGETAELPGLYAKGHFDLAGFVVGVVDAARCLDPMRRQAQAGDLVLAIPSDGFHSNGYSLIRRWLDESSQDIATDLIEKILRPTKIYSEIPDLLDRLPLGACRGIAHITGGGISGNLPRVLPEGKKAVIDWSKIQTPQWMQDFILEHANSRMDVEGVFNLGIGMTLVVQAGQVEELVKQAQQLGVNAYPIGQVEDSDEPHSKATVEYINQND